MFQIARKHQLAGLTHANQAFMRDFSKAIADIVTQ